MAVFTDLITKARIEKRGGGSGSTVVNSDCNSRVFSLPEYRSQQWLGKSRVYCFLHYIVFILEAAVEKSKTVTAPLSTPPNLI